MPNSAQPCRFMHELEGLADATRLCIVCHSPFCEEHRNPINEKVCARCTDPETAIKLAPLIDDEDVRHKGQILKPIGFAFKTKLQAIVEMDDDKLRSHIIDLKLQIVSLIHTLDVKRIEIASSECELEERRIGRQKRLRQQGIDMLASGAKIITNGSSGALSAAEKAARKAKKTADDLKGIASGLGIRIDSAEKLIKFAQMLKQIRESK